MGQVRWSGFTTDTILGTDELVGLRSGANVGFLASGFALNADNLLNLASAATARTNLGLGSAAVLTASAALTFAAACAGSVTIGNMAIFSDANGSLEQNVAALNNVANASATPGTVRSFHGEITSTQATQTSGNLVGVRGAVTFEGMTGGFLYGVQGKLVATGSISNSGGGFEAGVLGQFDMSAATLTSTSYMAPVWSDFGSTAPAGTFPQCYLFSGTNSTASILGAQINLYGGATALMSLNDNNGLVGATYFKAAGTTAGSWGNAPVVSKVLEINMNGTAYYLPIIAQNT